MKINRPSVFNLALIIGLLDYIALAYSGQSLSKAILLASLATALIMLACEIFNKIDKNRFYESKA